MRKAVVIIIALIILIFTACNREQSHSNGWMVSESVDEFKNPTGKMYVYAYGTGTYQDRFSAGELKLKVKVCADSSQMTIELYNENGDLLISNPVSDCKVEVLLLNQTGEKESYTGIVKHNDNRITIADDWISVYETFINSGTVEFYIEELPFSALRGFRYHFSINVDTFSDVYAKVIEEEIGEISAVSDKYSLTNAMMAYFMYSQYRSYVQNNYYYLAYMGLDTSKSLKSQNVSDNMISWFAYFMNVAKNQVNELVALASTAQEKGLSLDEEEIKEIDDTMKSIKEAAATNGYTSVNKYLASYYVTGVTESAVRKCLELQYLASKYYTELTDSYTYTDEEIQKYADDNPEKFLKFDYIYYTFKPEVKDGATYAEKKKALEEAKARAFELKGKITDAKSFLELITEMEKAKDDELEKDEKDYTEYYIKEGTAYTKDDGLTNWVDEEDRKDGDISIFETKNGDTVTGYTVYYLTKTFYKDDYATKNVRHILFGIGTYGDYADEIAAKKKAEEILAEYKNGDMTEESFSTLARKYTNDSNADRGGLYENVEKNVMVTPFNDWIYDDERKPGDTGIVETSYGQHLMYFVGDGKVSWKVTAEDNLKSEQYEKELEELEIKYPVTYDAEKLSQIP